MNNSDYDPETRELFYERYTHYSDQQIKEILRNHKDYQEAAVTSAIKIAIEREIIHSDQDLMAPEYQTKLSRKPTAFPVIPDAFQYKKIVRSIFRILFLVSCIPIFFGILKYAEGNLLMSFQSIGIGLLWLILTFMLLKIRNQAIIFIQLLIVIPLAVILGIRLTKFVIFPVTDMFVLVIITTLIIYFLLYLRKLFLTEPEQPGHQ